jgi:hypothetical protein
MQRRKITEYKNATEICRPTAFTGIYSNRSLQLLGYSLIFITIIFIITTDLVLLSGRWDSSLKG